MKFVLTEDHINLLQHAYTGWNDCEFGSPGIDCKRPYGSKRVYKDMAKILGIAALGYAGSQQPGADSGDEFAIADTKRMDQLHKEMETVLLIMFRTLKAVPGEYEIDGVTKVALIKSGKPKYYVRSDDFMVFSINEDGETYSIDSSKIKYHEHLHHKYPEHTLVANGFFVGKEEDLPKYAKQQAEYYKNMAKSSDSHGHGDDDDAC